MSQINRSHRSVSSSVNSSFLSSYPAREGVDINSIELRAERVEIENLDLRKKLTKVKTKLDTSIKEKHEIWQSLQVANRELANLSNNANSTNSQQHVVLSELQLQLQQRNKELKLLRQESEEKVSRVTQYQQKDTELQALVTKLERQLLLESQRNDDLQVHQRRYAAELDQAQGQIEQHVLTVQKQRLAIEEMHASLQEKDVHISTINNNIQLQAKKIEDVLMTNQLLKDENDKIQQSCTDFKKEMATLRKSQSKQNEEEIIRNKKRLIFHNWKNASLQQKHEDELQESFALHDDEIDKERSQLGEEREGRERAEQLCLQLEQEINRLQEQVRQYQSVVLEKEDELAQSFNLQEEELALEKNHNAKLLEAKEQELDAKTKELDREREDHRKEIEDHKMEIERQNEEHKEKLIKLLGEYREQIKNMTDHFGQQTDAMKGEMVQRMQQLLLDTSSATKALKQHIVHERIRGHEKVKALQVKHSFVYWRMRAAHNKDIKDKEVLRLEHEKQSKEAENQARRKQMLPRVLKRMINMNKWHAWRQWTNYVREEKIMELSTKLTSDKETTARIFLKQLSQHAVVTYFKHWRNIAARNQAHKLEHEEKRLEHEKIVNEHKLTIEERNNLLEEHKKRHADEIEEHKKRHADEIEEHKKRHADEITMHGLKFAEHKNMHDKILAAHADEVTVHGNRIAEYISKHATELEQHKKNHLDEIEQHKKKHLDEIEQHKKKHLDEIESYKAQRAVEANEAAAKRKNAILSNTLKRMHDQRLWRAWRQWIQMVHTSKINDLEAKMSKEKQEKLKIIVKQLSHAGAVPAFRHWRIWAAKRQEQKAALLPQILNRMLNAKMWSAWKTWRDMVQNSKIKELESKIDDEKASRCEAVLLHWQNGKKLAMFHQWRYWSRTRQERRDYLIRRVVTRLSKQQLSKGWQAWCDHVWHGKVREEQKRRNSLVGHLDVLKAKHDSVQAKHDEVHDKHQELHVKHKELQDSHDNVHKQHKDLHEMHLTTKQELEQALKTLEQIEMRSRNLEQQLSEFNSENKGLKEEIVKLEHGNTRLKEVMKAAEREWSEESRGIKNTRDTLQQDCNSLKQELTNRMDMCESLKSQLTQAQGAIEMAVNTCSELEQKLLLKVEIEKENVEYKAKIDNLSEELKQHGTRIKRLVNENQVLAEVNMQHSHVKNMNYGFTSAGQLPYIAQQQSYGTSPGRHNRSGQFDAYVDTEEIHRRDMINDPLVHDPRHEYWPTVATTFGWSGSNLTLGNNASNDALNRLGSALFPVGQQQQFQGGSDNSRNPPNNNNPFNLNILDAPEFRFTQSHSRQTEPRSHSNGYSATVTPHKSHNQQPTTQTSNKSRGVTPVRSGRNGNGGDLSVSGIGLGLGISDMLDRSTDFTGGGI